MTALTGSPEGHREMARIALAMLTMRVNTETGHWLEATFERAYFDLWDDAREIDGEAAAETLFLLMMNMAADFVQALATTDGRPVEHYLALQRRDIDVMRFEGEDDEDGS